MPGAGLPVKSSKAILDTRHAQAQTWPAHIRRTPKVPRRIGGKETNMMVSRDPEKFFAEYKSKI